MSTIMQRSFLLGALALCTALAMACGAQYQNNSENEAPEPSTSAEPSVENPGEGEPSTEPGPPSTDPGPPSTETPREPTPDPGEIDPGEPETSEPEPNEPEPNEPEPNEPEVSEPEPNEPEPNEPEPNEPEPNEPEAPEPTPDGLLDLTYVSGHLGSYGDCPERGFVLEGEIDGDMDGDSLTDEDSAACEEGMEGECFLNCEDAQVTFRIDNLSAEDALDVEVVEISLLDEDGTELVQFEVLETETTMGEPFVGVVEGDAFVDVRVMFQGPRNLFQLIDALRAGVDNDGLPSSYAPIRIVVDASNQDPSRLDTPDLYDLPDVDTK